MVSSVEIEHRICILDGDISRLANQQAIFRYELISIYRDTFRLKLKSCYFQFVAWFRSPADRFNLWPIGVMLCGPALIAAVFFVTSHIASSSLSITFLSGVCGALVGIGTFSILLKYPKSEVLQKSVRGFDVLLVQYREKAGNVRRECASVSSKLKLLRREKAQLVSSIQIKREQLLRVDWKAMRGVQWEEYLKNVCSALGYSVETTKASGDQGVDLVVQRGSSRIAIQAKGYANSVSNSAVQEAVAGMKVYNCNGCAVITNSRFTKSAVELAVINGCVLISEESFEDFVRGRVRM